jgi:hypothetical protein
VSLLETTTFVCRTWYRAHAPSPTEFLKFFQKKSRRWCTAWVL